MFMHSQSQENSKIDSINDTQINKKEDSKHSIHMNIEKYNERRHAKMAKFNNKGIF